VLPALLLVAPVVHAQGPWGLTLFVDPFPSPYASDWEANPNISTLTIVNPTGAEQDVRIAYQVVDRQGRVLAGGHSDPLGIPPGAPTVLTSILDIEGASQRDAATWDIMARSGRIPEGEYTACVTMAAGSGLVLGEDCASFTIIYPDPPQLLAPAPDEILTSQSPFFQWTPIQAPPAYPARYVLQVAEMLSNQTPEEALSATIVFFQDPDLDVTTVQYPVNGQPFEPGKWYAWRVIAIDATGFPPTANGGLSEIRTFRFDDGSGVTTGERTEISLTLTNAFEDEAAPATTLAAGASPPIDLADLCRLWDQPITGIVISSSSPIGLRRFAGQAAALWRDSTAERWWIATRNAKTDPRAVLVGGDCAPDGKTRPRYIASRDTSLQRRVNGMLTSTPGDVVARPAPGAPPPDPLFAMVVLARASETVEAPAGFTEAEEFLDGHTLDVSTGLNLFMSVSLRQWGMWPWFESLGFRDRGIELTGFLGWDASWSIGGAIGQTAGVDVSTERKFLLLRAALPTRTSVDTVTSRNAAGATGTSIFQRKWWKRMGLALEITLGDSTGRGFSLDEHRKLKKDPGYSLELIGKLVHTIEVNDEVSLVGYIGLDLAYESSRGPAKEMLDRWDWMRGVRRSATDWLRDRERYLQRIDQWLAGKVEPQVYSDDPEVGLDVMFGYGVEGRIGSLWGAEQTAVRVDGLAVDMKYRMAEKRLTVAVSATLAIQDVEGVVKVGASKVFVFGAAPDTTVLKREQRELIVGLQDAIIAASLDGGQLPDCGGNRDHDHPVCKASRALSAKNKELEAVRGPSWRARLSAGHMSLGALLDLLRNAGP